MRKIAKVNLIFLAFTSFFLIQQYFVIRNNKFGKCELRLYSNSRMDTRGREKNKGGGKWEESSNGGIEKQKKKKKCDVKQINGRNKMEMSRNDLS